MYEYSLGRQDVTTGKGWVSMYEYWQGLGQMLQLVMYRLQLVRGFHVQTLAVQHW